MPRRVIGAVASLGLIVGLGLVSIPAATAADSPCVGDSCDGGAWAEGRGAANERSYWGMYAGHNCTNYVAWRLIQDGIAEPPTSPGSADSWAANALLDGYRVDAIPTAGSVAHWGSFEGGYGVDGHVAYVEKVNDDGSILVSEDFWRGGTQTGSLTFRKVDPAKVSDFIHYADESDWLRTAASGAEGWTVSGTHLDLAPTALTAHRAADGTVEFFFAEDGRLWQASSGDGGWTAVATGISSAAESMSAVDLRDGQTAVMSIDAGEVVMSLRTATGWQRMPTGITATTGGEVAVVDLQGLLPTVYASVNGRLWRVWGDTEGWHAEFTGVVLEGPIAAVLDSAGRPVVFSVGAGVLVHSWADDSGWHSESTGVAATGRVQAVWTETGPEVYLTQDGVVWRARTDGVSWTAAPIVSDAGAWLEVVDLGADEPFLALLG